jgi:hypothetical protein
MQRKQHSAEFKAKVALEALKGLKTGQFKIEVQRGLMRVKRVLGMALRSQEIYEVYG